MRSFAIPAVALSILLAGCAENKTRVGEGAGMGGLLGAAAGGIIGHQSGHGWEGALIGAGAGAAGGAMVGSQMEKPVNQGSGRTAEVRQVMTAPSMQQVVDFTKQGMTSDEIISRIRASNATYSLTADDLDYLRRQGVSQRVIEAMQGK
jgi:uncharacterized protein YcfJ